MKNKNCNKKNNKESSSNESQSEIVEINTFGAFVNDNVFDDYNYDFRNNYNSSHNIESLPCTLGALYHLQCLIMVGSFVTIMICLINIFEIFIQNNRIQADLQPRITVFIHLFFAIIAFINAIVAQRPIIL